MLESLMGSRSDKQVSQVVTGLVLGDLSRAVVVDCIGLYHTTAKLAVRAIG